MIITSSQKPSRSFYPRGFCFALVRGSFCSERMRLRRPVFGRAQRGERVDGMPALRARRAVGPGMGREPLDYSLPTISLAPAATRSQVTLRGSQIQRAPTWPEVPRMLLFGERPKVEDAHP